MPVQIDLMSLMIAVMLLIIVIFLVPMMKQVKSTSQHFDEFVSEAKRELLPMLRELREASERLNRASSKVEEGMGRVDNVLGALEEVGDSIHSVNDFLQRDVGRYVGNVAGLWLGFRSASKVFIKQLVKAKKGGD